MKVEEPTPGEEAIIDGLRSIFYLLDERLPKEEPAWMRDGIIPTLQRMSDEKRARAERAEAEVRADERAKVLAGFTEWYAPAYTAPNGNTCPIGPETVAREFAESDARDMASPEDETPVYVALRLVSPWTPEP